MSKIFWTIPGVIVGLVRPTVGLDEGGRFRRIRMEILAVKAPPIATRDRIIQTATELFLQKGFSATSVEDILGKVSIAKGTFYHHFPSKEALLETVTDQFSRVGFEEVMHRVDSAKLNSPLAKLNLLFRLSMEWKDENIESMMAILEALYRETNISLRVTLRNKSKKLTLPIVQTILDQGKRAGVFHFEDSYYTSDMILLLLEGLSEHLTDDLLFDSNPSVEKSIRNFQIGIEKLLGLPSESVRLVDRLSYQSIKEKITGYKRLYNWSPNKV